MMMCVEFISRQMKTYSSEQCNEHLCFVTGGEAVIWVATLRFWRSIVLHDMGTSRGVCEWNSIEHVSTTYNVK